MRLKINYQVFENTPIEILKNLAPIKKKLVKTNQALYLAKALRKGVMRRSELKTKHFKLKTNDTWKAYKNRKITAVDFTRKK